MDMNTLYKYLKLVIPNEFKVVKQEYSINVSNRLNRNTLAYAFSDSYFLKDNYIVLSRLTKDIPEYAQKIFGKPVSINRSYLAHYMLFNIPEELRDLDEPTEP